jgi:hypothetical protein
MSSPHDPRNPFTDPCKIGTIPMVVQRHRRDRLEVGRYVRIKERSGARWERVLVTRVDPDGYFMADKM